MDDIENVTDVISAIQEGDYDVVSQAIDQGHVTATALDQEGSISFLENVVISCIWWSDCREHAFTSIIRDE